MGMVVRTNMNSLNSSRNVNKNNHQVAKAIEKLASGYAINKAADDAAGLAISEKMRSQITGIDQGTKNCLDGVCLVQVAEGAMNEIHGMLNRAVELATKSANGTINDQVDREAIQAEISVLVDEIDRIAEATNYNGIPLLTGMSVEEIIGYHPGALSSTSATKYTDILGGVNNVSTNSASDYVTDEIKLAVDETKGLSATSVPSDAILPYTISFETIVFDEVTGDIKNQLFELVVDDSSGSVTAIGYVTTNGTKVQLDDDYINEEKNTNLGSSTGVPGIPYISDFATNGITSTEMTYIMEDILEKMSSPLSAGGDWYLPTQHPNYPPDTSGNGYPNFPYPKEETDYVYANEYYLSASYDSEYGQNMNIYASYSSTVRVLGVISTVTDGSNQITSQSNPSDFDYTYWQTATSVDGFNDNILGLNPNYKGEPSRTLGTISTPMTESELLAMSDDDLRNLIFTVSQTTETYPDDYEDADGPVEDTIKTKNYVALINPFTQIDPTTFFSNLLGEDVTVVIGEPSDPEHLTIDALCDKIASDFSVTATRRLDDIYQNVVTDPNYIDLYTIQIGTFTQKQNKWDPEPHDIIGYIKDPLIIHASDLNNTYNKIGIHLDDMRAEALNIENLSVLSQEEAGFSIDLINSVINKVSTNRSKCGSFQNRLEHAVNGNNTTSENLQVAKSNIKDCDMAKEMMELTKQNILTQSAQSMLVQSNQSLQQILSILG